MGQLAPEQELRVALRLLYRATTHARNLALNPTTPLKKLEDLMDAINHLPEWLADWEHFNETTFFIHLATYDDKWCEEANEFSLKQTYLDLVKFGAS